MSKDGPEGADVSNEWIQTFAGEHCLVTGGAGVIGRVLVERLLEAGARVTVIDKADRPPQWVGHRANLSYFQTLLSDISGVEIHWQGGADGPNYVFHLAAAFQRTEETADYLHENYLSNVEGSYSLLSQLHDEADLKAYVYASSYLCYDQTQYLFDTPPDKPVRLAEDAPLRPRNLTGAAKLLHETELTHLQQHRPEVRWTSARICRVYGRGSKDVLSRWIRAGLNDEAITAYGLESFFDYIYADDVAEGLLRLAAHAEAKGAFNLGSGKSRRVSDALDCISGALPGLVVNEQAPPEGFRYEASQVDMTKTFAALPGFRPRPIDAGLAKVFEFERERLAMPADVSTPTLSAIPACRILLTSCGAKQPLIEILSGSLQRVGLPPHLLCVDADPECITAELARLPSYRTGRGLEFVPLASFDELGPDAFIDFCRGEGITHVVPSRDGELAFMAELAETKPDGIHFFVTAAKVIERCLDKRAFAQFADQHGLSVIKTVSQKETLDTKRYVVKERRGAGSRKIGLNLSYREASGWAETLEEPVFQPYVAGREFSADSYVRPGGEHVATVLRWRDKVVNGESHITTSFADPAIEAQVIALLKAFGITHHSVTQGIVDSGGQVHFIEVNCRLGGASRLGDTLGVRSVERWLLETLFPEADRPDVPASQKPMRLVRYVQQWVRPGPPNPPL